MQVGVLAYHDNPTEIWGRARDLPPQVIAAYEGLADAQRGEPEEAMTQAQFRHGGVLNPLIEHVGDLTNRMAKDIAFDDAGYGNVREKVHRQLWQLRRGPHMGWMTFAEEHDHNVVNNAKYSGVPVAQYEARLREALDRYVAAHRELPAYNRAQFLARQAAVAVGSLEFERSRRLLTLLESLLVDEQTWWEAATEYRLGPDGEPLEYPW